MIQTLRDGTLAEKEPEFEEIRFDVVGILARTGENAIQHVRHAF